jgi:16S rRNA processing protein RimM
VDSQKVVAKTVSHLLPLGRVTGHRGRAGEFTVKIFRGEAGHWSDVRRVWLGDGDEESSVFEVEHARAYRDRLVLKLEGVEDPTAAEELRGSRVAVAVADAPELPEGEHYTALLVGMVVRDGERIVGRVIDVMPTGGKDVLVIEPPPGDPDSSTGENEILVPFVEEFVDVDQAAGVIRITPPEGLLDLNKS